MWDDDEADDDCKNDPIQELLFFSSNISHLKTYEEYVTGNLLKSSKSWAYTVLGSTDGDVEAELSRENMLNFLIPDEGEAGGWFDHPTCNVDDGFIFSFFSFTVKMLEEGLTKTGGGGDEGAAIADAEAAAEVFTCKDNLNFEPILGEEVWDTDADDAAARDSFSFSLIVLTPIDADGEDEADADATIPEYLIGDPGKLLVFCTLSLLLPSVTDIFWEVINVPAEILSSNVLAGVNLPRPLPLVSLNALPSTIPLDPMAPFPVDDETDADTFAVVDALVETDKVIAFNELETLSLCDVVLPILDADNDLELLDDDQVPGFGPI